MKKEVQKVALADTCQNETHNLTKQELLVATPMCLSKTRKENFCAYQKHETTTTSLPKLAKKKALAQVENTIGHIFRATSTFTPSCCSNLI
jgi:hypothetical protein